AYGVRVAFDAGGRPLAAEAEADAPDGIVGDARELRAEPQHVARLLRDLERAPPPHLAGVLWFRLPTDDDRRAWSLATLRAVVVGAPLAAHFEARLVDAADGARDLIVANRGVVDAAPPSLRVDARACLAGDAGQGYDLRHGTGVWRFVAAGDAPLRAGRERSVGWLRCDIVEKVNIDATPSFRDSARPRVGIAGRTRLRAGFPAGSPLRPRRHARGTPRRRILVRSRASRHACLPLSGSRARRLAVDRPEGHA